MDETDNEFNYSWINGFNLTSKICFWKNNHTIINNNIEVGAIIKMHTKIIR